MSTPYHNAEGFINGQIEDALAKYEEWKQARRHRGT
jgi:hypothetical protein